MLQNEFRKFLIRDLGNVRGVRSISICEEGDTVKIKLKFSWLTNRLSYFWRRTKRDVIKVMGRSIYAKLVKVKVCF